VLPKRSNPRYSCGAFRERVRRLGAAVFAGRGPTRVPIDTVDVILPIGWIGGMD
jgi:hypothetical protein